MKVLKKGRPQKGWAGTFTCTGIGNGGGGCGAKLLVEYSDLYKTYSHALSETDTHITFRCVCGVETDIKYTGPKPYEIPDKFRTQSGGFRD